MNIIDVGNCYSFLKSSDEDIKNTLWSCLRFRERGYFHSRLYRQKKWDGYRDFFGKKSGRFLTGLLPEVVWALKEMGKEYTIEDHRRPIKFIKESITSDLLYPFNKKMLHDYQTETVNLFLSDPRKTVLAPTSSGKTYIAISILHCVNPNTKVLFIGHRKSLIQQTYEDMKSSGLDNVGIIYDKANEVRNINCVTIQSLHKIKDFVKDVEFVIVDEVHEMMSAERMKCYTLFNNAYAWLALSATPYKYEGKDLVHKYKVKGFFGPLLKLKESTAAENGVLTIKKLQERKQLSNVKCYFHKIREPNIEHDIYIDAVTRGIAENVSFHRKISEEIVPKLTGRTLIIVERISHGDFLNVFLKGSLWIQGKDNMETRKFVIEQLQKSKNNVVAIATQGIFNTGINVFVHNLINAAGGYAAHQIEQRFGRGLRVADDKEILRYHDFIFLNNPYLEKHSLARYELLKNKGYEIEVLD